MYDVAIGETFQVPCSEQKQCGHEIYRSLLGHLGMGPLIKNRVVMLCLAEIRLNGHCYIASMIYSTVWTNVDIHID